MKRRCPLAHHQSKIRSEFCPVSSQPRIWCPNLGRNNFVTRIRHSLLLPPFCYFFSFTVSGGEDGCIYFFHVDDSSFTTRRVPAHASAVLSVAVNYNGAYLASGDSRGIVMLWGRPIS